MIDSSSDASIAILCEKECTHLKYFFFKSMPTLSRLPKFQQKAKAKKKKTSRRHQINISWIQENEKKKANEMDLKE